MWAIENQTEFEAERSFVRDRDGAEIFLVAVRATFNFDEHGRLSVADEQVPVAQSPCYTRKAGASSLRWDTDLSRTKNGTDVLLNGSAYATDGVPQESVQTMLKVGPIEKQLTVIGDRHLLGQSVSDPEKFTKMPINYERAYGGAGSDENPIGTGLNAQSAMMLPNVTGSSEDSVAGYGALPCSWRPRRDYGGTYNQEWERQRKPLVPEDFDDAYFYSAPSDQQVPGFLKGGELVELINLTPNGRIEFQLPKITFGFTSFIDGGREHHRGELHSVIIEPDERTLYMVWHSQLPCHNTLYTLENCIVYEKTPADFREQE